MSYFSELDIDRQEGRSIQTVSRSDKKTRSLPKPSEEPATSHPSDRWGIYWRLCLRVVDAAGDLAAVDKLAMNYRDPAKRFNVEAVVAEHYPPCEEAPSSTTCLADARNDAARYFFTEIDNLNGFAIGLHLDQVSGMTLMGQLEDGKIRRKFRDHIRRHIESGHPPFELDELPVRDFRKKKT